MSFAKIDYHCHTFFSFDSEAEPEKVCESAIRRGIKYIAITDHCDYDCILQGLYDRYSAQDAKKEVLRLKDKFAEQLDISYGIELGGAHIVPKEAAELVSEQQFDFVLGSLHNLKGAPDFYFMDFSKMPIGLLRSLLHRNIAELCEVAKLPFVDSIAHITYPIRYMQAAGKTLDLSEFSAEFNNLFRIIIENDKALEVNTSPYRKGIRNTMPDTELLRQYRQSGGTRITVGSDSHTPDGVGDGVKETLSVLKDLGFENITLFSSDKRRELPITELE